MTAAIWCLIWLGVAAAMAIALGMAYTALDRALDRLWPQSSDDPDNYLDPLRPAGERRRQ